MDNLTHSLIGLVAGEAMARCTAPDPRGLPAPARRNALIAISIIGSNLPDVDLAWSMQFVTGDRMGYLLQHRGHTHTLLGCLALAALLLMGTWLWHRYRHRQWSAGDLRSLGAMALLAVLLHLGLDALNSYGVHPFWPWDNRWKYGDRLFIVEPLFWLATAPLLLVVVQRWPARLVLGLVLLAGSALLKVAHTAMVVAATAGAVAGPSGLADSAAGSCALKRCALRVADCGLCHRWNGRGTQARCTGGDVVPGLAHARSCARTNARQPAVLGRTPAASIRR
jgi:membrane-bound metal-dependent hydrolase YbcI (DUF457 family)